MILLSYERVDCYRLSNGDRQENSKPEELFFPIFITCRSPFTGN
ncbi:MAG: hypothetical protein WBA41_25925 [Rivularia sp. (in: cyanobacteria)]